ncbi:predicted protein [Chaetomium globosum CBS 148.51]|uniref:Secreted protein n=1 Tax=Chaetomium globosum (strain ATCC 6205 / CBS 148.51 / DSM 1962 / NBRC 6347 / NRRL 1970) TaxID=306901 RepID=Q2H5V4_CHAGB|nr:uncharacterized protein CHGG_05961 [Chaetomium globosum CBS 148.51]EAQ89342.1 predicted protein [Chaetomium globosum CBS 148.51]
MKGAVEKSRGKALASFFSLLLLPSISIDACAGSSSSSSYHQQHPQRRHGAFFARQLGGSWEGGRGRAYGADTVSTHTPRPWVRRRVFLSDILQKRGADDFFSAPLSRLALPAAQARVGGQLVQGLLSLPGGGNWARYERGRV